MQRGKNRTYVGQTFGVTGVCQVFTVRINYVIIIGFVFCQ